MKYTYLHEVSNTPKGWRHRIVEKSPTGAVVRTGEWTARGVTAKLELPFGAGYLQALHTLSGMPGVIQVVQTLEQFSATHAGKQVLRADRP